MNEYLDHVVLNFNKDSLVLLNVCLAFIMFGVALELKIKNFKQVFRTPIPVITGLISQFILLPAVTFLLVVLIKPSAGIALGMFLVAACPGGNVSNFFSMMSKGNVALSVSITAISTLLSVVMTPFNLAFWSSMYAPTHEILEAVNLNVLSIVSTIFLVLIIPLFGGMIVREKKPTWALKISGPIRKVSLLIFGAFVVIALAANFQQFINYISVIIFLVAIHNALAFGTGYLSSFIARLPEEDRRSITIETGIQNSGLGLVLIFDFFQGLGGMAIITAWWGIWHLLSGLAVSWFWSKKKLS
ncbi:MAG: BASS family bile acid:Na+ symporter [Bacteroidia bacterium]